MAGNNDQLGKDVIIKVVAVAAVGMFVVKPILNKFGHNPEDDKEVQENDELDPENNPFNSNFVPYHSLYDKYGDTNKFWQQWAYEVDNSEATELNGTDRDIALLGNTLHDAFSYIPGAQNDDDITYVFHSLHTQADVGALAAYMQAVFNIDLMQTLKNGTGMPWSGLNNTDLSQIIRFVKSLPPK